MIDETVTIEREVRGSDGSWYQLRIRSYKDLDNRIDGAVLSLFDLHEIKAREREVSHAHRLIDELLATTPFPLAVADPDLRLRAVSPPFALAVGAGIGALAGQRLAQVASAAWAAAIGELTRQRPRRRGNRQSAVVVTTGDGASWRLQAQRLQVVGGEELILLSIHPG